MADHNKRCSKCDAVKDRADFYRCRALPDGLKTLCKACCDAKSRESPDRAAQRQREYRERHPERIAATFKRWYEANKEGQKKRSAERYASNKEYAAAANKAWLASHAEERKAYKTAYRRANKAIVNESNMRRHASKRGAQPVWVNADAIALVYKKAVALGLEVDHVVPLRSRIVCGLHCEANLQLLSRADNRLKSNRFWPDMP